MKKLSVDELTHLAFLSAESDIGAFLAGMYDSDTRYEETKSLYEQIRSYRLKRWGRSTRDRVFDSLVQADVRHMLARKVKP